MGCGIRVRLALLLATCVVSTGCAWAQVKPGITVEKVAKYSDGEKAGLQAGDVLLGWHRDDARGEIHSPFDLSDIETEQAPRGSVTLEGLRGAEKQTWVMGPDDWGIKARPNLPLDLLSIYLEGQQLAKAGKQNDAVERWRAAAAEAQKSSSISLSAWLLFHSAEQLADVQRWKEADGPYGESAQQAMKASPVIAVQVLQAWAATFQQRSDWDHAEKYYQQAIMECRRLGADNLIMALNLSGLGTMANDRGNQVKAEEYHHQALEIREKLAPESLAVASSYQDLGVAAQDHGDLANAEKYIRQALAIREKLAPGSLHAAKSLNQLGYWYWVRGDLVNADEYFRQAFLIQEKLAPDSLDFATSLNNLGMIATQRSDLGTAEKYFQRSLAIREKLSPESLSVAKCLNNLASIAQDRGDLALAAEYYRRSLIICTKVVPDSVLVPLALDNLGEVARTRGDLARAQEYHRRGLEAAEHISPYNVYVAISLDCLGRVADSRGEWGKAERYFHQALALYDRISPNTPHYYSASILNSLGVIREERSDLIGAEEYYRKAVTLFEKLSPSSLDVARGLELLGNVVRKRGDLGEAEEYYGRSLAILENSSPGSLDHANVLAALAGIKCQKQHPDEALRLYEQALNAFESQTARLGGSEDVRSSFRAKYANYYKDYIDLLIIQKKPERAFDVLEHLRARSLLETLAAAHVNIRTGADPVLLEKEHALQQSFSAKSNQRVELLGGKHTSEQLAALDKEVKDILEHDQDVEEQIRATSPAYAALTQPQPLSAREIQQQLLDANTILLEYSLGEDRSYVFAVTSTSLDTYELPGQAKIESVARSLYELVKVPDESGRIRGEAEAIRKAGLNQSLVALSRMVLAPVAAQINGKRLLVVSDGALQYIPFAMLPDLGPGADSSGSAPLIAGHEIVNLPSASVLAVLRQQTLGRKEAPKAVAVLADPVFDEKDERVVGRVIGKTGARASRAKTVSGLTDEITSVSVSAEHLSRSVEDVGLRARGAAYLPRLPFSRREAEAILAVTPEGEGMKAVDFLASRETAISPGLARYRIVHFATHGLFDSEHPELSGLVLSLVNEHGEAQNGFLDLEDIYNLNLPAELVVLSACETGLGKEINGEGLVGLTRGFMHAGAKRVVASLWKTDDAASAALMAEFYTAMEKDQMPPAAALRQAQIEMLKQPRWADPYYWAGFQLQGEWR